MGITSRLFFIYWKVQVHIKKQRELHGYIGKLQHGIEKCPQCPGLGNI